MRWPIRDQPSCGRARCIFGKRCRVGGQDKWSLNGRAEAVSARDQLKESGVVEQDSLRGEGVCPGLKRRGLFAQLCQAGVYLNDTNQISAELHHEERHDQRLPKEDERSARGAGASADQGPHESSFRAPPNRVKQGRYAG